MVQQEVFVGSVSAERIRTYKRRGRKKGDTKRDSNNERADVTMTHCQRRSARVLSVEDEARSDKRLVTARRSVLNLLACRLFL